MSSAVFCRGSARIRAIARVAWNSFGNPVAGPVSLRSATAPFGPLNWLHTMQFGKTRLWLGVLHSAMAPCGPLYSLRTTPTDQSGSNQWR